MTILEIIFLIAFGISAIGNVAQAIFGIKIENNQSQVVQTYNVNLNENNNLNLLNNTIILTNAYISTTVTGDVTNFKMVFPVISTNLKVTDRKMWAITNQSNYTKIGLIPR